MTDPSDPVREARERLAQLRASERECDPADHARLRVLRNAQRRLLFEHRDALLSTADTGGAETGERLCQAFADTFEGGGWADAPVWSDFDERQQQRWQRAADRYAELAPPDPALQAALAEVERLRASNKALVEAVEPFARRAQDILPGDPDTAGMTVKIGDLRKIAALAAQVEVPADGEGTGSASAVSAARKSAAPDLTATLEGCAGWLRDTATNYRADAANLVGGMRNRMFGEADDCNRWADAIEAALAHDAPRSDGER